MRTIMKVRATAWLAWLICALYVALIPPTLVLQTVNQPSDAVWSDLFSALVLLAFAVVGAAVATRLPRNPIGWIFCASALVQGAGVLALEYAVYALITHPSALPGGAGLAVLGAWARAIGWILLVTFPLLLFPDGRLPSRRWQVLVWLIVVDLALFSMGILLAPTALDLRLPAVRNPIGSLSADLANFIQAVAGLLMFAVIAACAAAAIVRFRRAGGKERQQLKWLAYSGVWGVAVIGPIVANILFGTSAPSNGILFNLATVGIPIAMGIAILRYRLYDIDVLINRTLVYGSLTATLALIYFGSVVLIQRALLVLTGQQSEVALVVSTLAIAALFQPLRRRIQVVIDRRFYRRKYDSAQIVAAFGARLRDEVDLNTLTADLVAVVADTMQPAHVSLWLRDNASERR